MISFEQASILDPTWIVAKDTLEDLIKYLTSTQNLYQRKGQVKNKRLQQMTEVILRYVKKLSNHSLILNIIYCVILIKI